MQETKEHESVNKFCKVFGIEKLYDFCKRSNILYKASFTNCNLTVASFSKI